MEKLTVAVILGGLSTEREVSLRTGEQVAAALRNRGHRVVEIDPADYHLGMAARGGGRTGGAQEDGRPPAPSSLAGAARFLRSLAEVCVDVAYIALHGAYGEDGRFQGFLDLLGIPYVGSGVLASALAMDKPMAKLVFASQGIPVAKGEVLERAELEQTDKAALLERVERNLGWPAVIKPADQGSAVGVTIAHGPEPFWDGLRKAFRFGQRVLIEEYIPGMELTVAVVGRRHMRSLPAIEIVPRKTFYDYEAKYAPGGSEHIIPARLPGELLQRAAEISIRACQSLGCRDLARVDLRVPPSGEMRVLEVNTLPGMTATSLVPDAARAAGIQFPDLLEKLLQMALGQEPEW
ncbi:MAG: D-alanine--D-alanine ligase [Firmicutes bacterium]|nr:D-alanine--D-alanine ligase [Bacillota bacterium]